ncbi:MAG TPA: DUF1444 family protein [Burkholderiaceae bacterium]
MGIFDWFKKSRPSRDEFAAMYEKYLRERRLAKEVQYDAEAFLFRIEGVMAHSMNLENIYRDYCKVSKQERPNLLRRYSASMKFEEITESWETVRKQLMPAIRTISQNEVMRLSQLAEEGSNKGYDNFLFRPFSEDASIMIAHDREDSIMMVNKDVAEKWGVTFDEAWQACLDNLRARSPEKPRRLEDGVVQCLWDDSYDSSRILLPDLLNRSGAGIDPVIMIPTRDCLLLAAASNPQTQARMVDYAGEAMEQQGRFVSALMYRYSGTGLTRYVPAEPAVARKLHDLRTRALMTDYAQQRDLLEKADKKNGRDLFHASFKVFESKRSGGLVSVASVTRDALGSIPQTDLIGFAFLAPGGKQGVKFVAWNDVMMFADGWLIRDEQHYPPRYRVEGFPAQDKLDAAPAASL